jgi:CubicO group peptidase (beta-lactamase class C family)
MVFIKRLMATFGAILCLALSFSASAQLPDNIDEVIEKVRQSFDIAGLSVAVVKYNEVVYAKGFGVREIEKPDLVDENTLFAIGSNSKAFTSASIGMLVDEGKMSWDDKVTKHLPWFELYDPYVTREITIRDILSHRSGLGRRGDLNWYGTDYSREEIVRRIRYLEPNSSFRTEMGYQNTMFIAAGLVAAQVSGMSWDDLIKTRIFEPLGMKRSNTSILDLSKDNNVAYPHQLFGDVVKPIPYRNIDAAGPAGSINSSALEMTHWMRMILNNGEFDGNRLISEVVVKEVQKPHIFIPVSAGLKGLRPSTHFLAYGLGWSLSDYKGAKTVTHTGGIDGMLSEITIVPEHGLGIIVLTNTSIGGSFSTITATILDAYLGGPTKDWRELYLDIKAQGEEAQKARTEKLIDSRVEDTKPSLKLSDYVGDYENKMYGKITVSFDGEALVLKRHTSFVGKLKHWHFDTFYARWDDLALSVGPGTEIRFEALILKVRVSFPSLNKTLSKSKCGFKGY